jgi:hypothetical protein
MKISDVYENVMRLEEGSVYDLCASREIDIRLVEPPGNGDDFPVAALIGQYGSFGILLNQKKLVSLENTEFILLHELGHYENELESGYGRHYSHADGDSPAERYANLFAVFRLIPKHPLRNESIFKTASEKGIPYNIIKSVLFQLSLDPDPFFRNYYAEYII